MVDAADREKVEASRNELHNLLDKPQLQGIPVSHTFLFCTPLHKHLFTFTMSAIPLFLISGVGAWK